MGVELVIRRGREKNEITKQKVNKTSSTDILTRRKSYLYWVIKLSIISALIFDYTLSIGNYFNKKLLFFAT